MPTTYKKLLKKII